MPALPRPYYTDDRITLYCADCREIMPALEPESVALVLADPPYGVAEPTDRKARGRGTIAGSVDFAPVAGDDRPFEPRHLLEFCGVDPTVNRPRKGPGGRPLVIFGANYFPQALPPSPSWILWDKREDTGPDDNADGELAWSNLGGPARIFRHLWRGMIRASERGEGALHPTQKPAALASWIILERARVPPGGLVLDPYAGAGWALVAAHRSGRRAIGIELERAYCEVIVDRLRQRVLPLGI